MKVILLISILLCIPFAFGQHPIERLKTLPEGTKSLQQKYRVDFNGDFNNYGFISIKDSLTNEVKIVPNLGQIDTWSEFGRTFDGQFCQSFYETTPPPLLDSLDDGLYAFFYTGFPYADGDTIKTRTDAVYALIPVKNYQINGVVKWYYPNGNLAQQSEYVNNEKQGLTIVNYLDVSNTKIRIQEQKNYNRNIEHGTFKTLYNKSIQKDYKLLATVPFIEEGTKLNGKHNGDYSITTNGETFISGRFKNGDPIDSWIIKQWKIKGKKLILLPNMEFEVNDEKHLIHQESIALLLIPQEESKKNQYGMLSYRLQDDGKNFASQWLEYIKVEHLVEEWNVDQFYFGKTGIGSGYPLSEIQNCLGLLDKSRDNQLWIPVSGWYPNLVDSTGKQYKEQDVIHECGILYDLKKFKTFYPNGKLWFDIDYMDTTNFMKAPVYRQNGKLLSEMTFLEDQKMYRTVSYDSTGTIETEDFYDEKGKFIRSTDFSKKRIVNGDTLVSYNGFNWSFSRREIDSTLNQDICKSIEIDYKTDQVLRSHHYNPVLRKGSMFQLEQSTGTSQTFNYQYDETYSTIEFSTDIRFHDFKTSFTAKTDGGIIYWNDLSNLENYKLENLKVEKLLYKNQPVNARFQISISKKNQVKFSKGTFHISIPDQDFKLFNKFLESIHPEVKITERVMDQNRWHFKEEIRNQLELKTKRFSIADGRICDSIISKAEHFYISKYFIINDSSVKYNTFNKCYEFNNNYFAIGKLDSNWVSEITAYNPILQTYLFLEFNQKGDTLNYNFEDNINQIKLGYSNEYGENTRWNSNKGIIEKYSEKDRYNGKHFAYNREQQICKQLNKDSTLSTEFLLENDQLYKINRFDDQHLLAEETFVKNGYSTHFNKYHNGFLTLKIKYYEVDSVIPDLQGLPLSLDGQLVRYYIDSFSTFGFGLSPRYVNKTLERQEITKFQGDKIVEIGSLISNKKSGIWNYDYPFVNKFQMEFRDTTYHYETASEYTRSSYTGNYLEKDSLGKILKSGTFYEYNSEYSCTDDNHTEQYIIEYDIYNGKPTAGTTQYVVNHYSNGNKMNEGNLVNGKPDGLWKWYHNDGLLYEIGKYKNGIREGRWLQGDLSKVRFTGEMCLDPSSADFKEIMKTIVVVIEYYESGLLSRSEEHELQTE